VACCLVVCTVRYCSGVLSSGVLRDVVQWRAVSGVHRYVMQWCAV